MMRTMVTLLFAALLMSPVAAAPTAKAPSHPASGRAPGALFRDCPECPQMVVIPPGRFTMGSPPEEKAWAATRGATADSVSDEAPQHAVSLRSFALGRYDVTVAEYAAFVRETGYPEGDGCGPNGEKWDRPPGVTWRKPGYPQTARDPVVCVSWQDAQAYVGWLNGKARRRGGAVGADPYRLPSESEWEYAARAGTTTRFWWGDDETAAAAHAWFGSRAGHPPVVGNSGGRTHPVGGKPANRFGLYDMAGNVWQWTADCYAETYAAAPPDGAPFEAKACMRVDRGGSWLYATWLLRPATRERNPADFRDTIMGFRVAKTLP
jgi:formylglycine-generating enzyme required for sulfatase activity